MKLGEKVIRCITGSPVENADACLSHSASAFSAGSSWDGFVYNAAGPRIIAEFMRGRARAKGPFR